MFPYRMTCGLLPKHLHLKYLAEAAAGSNTAAVTKDRNRLDSPQCCGRGEQLSPLWQAPTELEAHSCRHTQALPWQH